MGRPLTSTASLWIASGRTLFIPPWASQTVISAGPTDRIPSIAAFTSWAMRALPFS